MKYLLILNDIKISPITIDSHPSYQRVRSELVEVDGGL